MSYRIDYAARIRRAMRVEAAALVILQEYALENRKFAQALASFQNLRGAQVTPGDREDAWAEVEHAAIEIHAGVWHIANEYRNAKREAERLCAEPARLEAELWMRASA